MAQDMTERERFIATLTFQSPDRIPMRTMGPRESTLARWRAEGLPARSDWFVEMCRVLRIPYEFPRQPVVSPAVNVRMLPTFEERVLSHENGHYIVQDWMGNITEISDAYDVTYIRTARDFVTRKWHRFPVTNRKDFEEMKRRYDPDNPERFPEDYDERLPKLEARDYPVTISIPGPFWQIREWCGFEPLCMLFLDDPEFVAEMATFWSDFIAAMLDRLLSRCIPDSVHISEDMAYKGASMISPEMVRRHLLPVWQRWGAICAEAGVPIYDMDSDGKVDELIPLWIEAGLIVCDPIEVAAGCDIVGYRNRFGRGMAYTGGINKQAIAAGGRTIEDEMARIAPVVRSGGYIPGCDHGMPPDISWQSLLEFGRLWAELTGWL